jgi:hypothetical protein
MKVLFKEIRKSKKKEVVNVIKTNKKIALLLVLAMLMTMFVGAGTASAAGITYSPLNAPTYEPRNTPRQRMLRS